MCSINDSGTERDDRAATRYGCQMREVLQNVTGEEYYLRPGTYWYRNVAYGKGVCFNCIVINISIFELLKELFVVQIKS